MKIKIEINEDGTVLANGHLKDRSFTVNGKSNLIEDDERLYNDLQTILINYRLKCQSDFIFTQSGAYK